MSQIPIPQELQYSRIKPRGWQTKFKEWALQPTTSKTFWRPDDIVKFLFQLQYGYIDPYRSHFQLTVTTNQTLLPVGSLQVDNSAQSFFKQTVLTSANSQIQRITDYDTLAAALSDMGFSTIFKEGRQSQGVGYSNFDTSNNKSVTPVSGVTTLNAQGGGTGGWWINVRDTPHTISPTKCSGVLTGGDSFSQLTNNTAVTGINACLNTTNCHYDSTNFFYSGVDGQSPYSVSPSTSVGRTQLLAQTGRFMNMRAQYVNQKRYAIDSTSSYTNDVLTIPSGTIPGDWETGRTGLMSPYAATFPTTMSTSSQVLGVTGYVDKVSTIEKTCNIAGFTNPYNSFFSKGCNEPTISATVPSCQIAYGKVLPSPIPINTRTFDIPFLSAVLGLLIPPEQYLLIPMQCLKNMIIQITMNPHALFSSGKWDGWQFDTQGINRNIARDGFQIQNFNYNMHIYDFPDISLQQSISRQLDEGILISSICWQQASQYQIATGQSVQNNWQINAQGVSVGQVLCIFLSNDYLTYPYCRKQYRNSNNITSIQLKLGTDFIPPQPIIGNGGNPLTIDGTGNNYPFIQQIHKSRNFKFSCNTPYPDINTWNFALNGRVWDPSNKQTFYDPLMLNNPDYVWTKNSVNQDTALGMPSFHQNRAVGKALYLMTFEPFGHSKQYMTGIDTTKSRPFEVQFNCSQQNYVKTDQTLYIYTKQNILVKYTRTGIEVAGR